MYSLFTGGYDGDYSGYHWPEFNYIKNKYLLKLYQLQEYYHSRVYAVKGTNFLAILLNNLSIPMHYDNVRYVEACRSRMDYISKVMRMTSSTNPGILHNGEFYGDGVKEIIYSIDEYFDIPYVVKNWQDMISVKPLLHPKSDLDMMLPNGKRASSGDGLAAIAINIPMLALQYKCFLMDQFTKAKERQSMLGTVHFVHMCILPNMLPDSLDISIMNRLMNLFYGRPQGVSYLRHAIATANYTKQVDGVLAKVLYRLENTKLDDSHELLQIPTVYSKTMIDALQMPDFAPTRQIWWSLLLSRLDIMKFIIDVNPNQDNNVNRRDINELKTDLKYLRRDSILPNVMSKDMLFDVESEINDILAS